jgi:hypothetical protein
MSRVTAGPDEGTNASSMSPVTQGDEPFEIVQYHDSTWVEPSSKSWLIFDKDSSSRFINVYSPKDPNDTLKLTMPGVSQVQSFSGT